MKQYFEFEINDFGIHEFEREVDFSILDEFPSANVGSLSSAWTAAMDPLCREIVRPRAKSLSRVHLITDVQRLLFFRHALWRGLHRKLKHDEVGFNSNALPQLLGHPCHDLPCGQPLSIRMRDFAVFFSEHRFRVQ
jgi:hypothetical protein